MRVLFIVARVPGADFKGDQVRSLQQLTHLSARHRITLISLDTTRQPATIPPALRALCEQIIVIRHPWWRSLLGSARALLSGRPFQVEAYRSAGIDGQIERCLATSRFDLVHLQVARLAATCERTPPPPCVVDFVDALSLNMQRRAEHDRGPMAWIAAIEARRMRAYEQRVLRLAAGAAVSSVVDRDALGAPANLHLVDNGVDVDQFAYVSPVQRERGIVFVGNLGYFPNVDAVLWFADAVLPLVQRHCPEVTLTLVGARPHRLLQRLAARNAAVRLIGPVPATQPYLTRAAVAIAPMRAGSGQQLKVLEAMAAGTPVVLTPAVAASIEAEAERHYLVADDATAMAAAIGRLLDDAALRERLAVAARQCVEQRYTWRHAAERLERIWLQAANVSGD